MSADASRRMFGHRISASLMAPVTASLATPAAALMAFHLTDNCVGPAAPSQAGPDSCQHISSWKSVVISDGLYSG